MRRCRTPTGESGTLNPQRGLIRPRPFHVSVMNRIPEIDRGFAAPVGACQPLIVLVPGGPARIDGTYSSSWMRPSNVRLLIMSRATSG
jgi:hypothetical protein